MTEKGPNKASPASVFDDATVGLLTVIRALRKNWPIVVACAILAVGASYFYSKTLPRIYEATATIEMNPSVVQPLGEKADSLMPLGAGFFFDNQEYYETQYKIATSQRVMQAVSRDLNLAADYEFFGAKSPMASHPSVEDTALVLASRTRVEPVKGSRLFLLHVEDTKPERAKRLCEAIATTYTDQNLEMAVSATSDAVVWLNGQLEHVTTDLKENEDKLHAFKEENELPSTNISDAYNMIRVEMMAFDEALTKTRTRKQELLARHAVLEKVSSESPDDLPASELLSDSFLTNVRVQYQGALKERNDLMAQGKGENHPLVRAADEKVAQAKSALLAQVKNIKGAVEKDLAVITRQEAGELALYEESRKRAVDLNKKEIAYHRLDRNREQNEKLFALLTERTKEADLARMMRVNNIHLIDKPMEPTAPVRPNVSANLAIGLGVGLLLGLAIAWLRQMLDNSIKTPDDVEKRLGLTFVGLLPEIEDEVDHRPKKRRRNIVPQTNGITGHTELIVHERPASGIAEAARSLRTNLMFMNPDRQPRSLLVTSAAPSEGKTTVACNLAIALAQGGLRVCVVDCDLRRPRLHRIFDRAGDAGVTNVLVGDATIDDVARPTCVENLWCIPSGPIPPNPADMLHSERFKKFLRELAEHFDRVIIDSPPLVAVTDSAIVSTLVDGTLFVIRAFKTTLPLCRQGLRTLADVDAPVVGAVLNAVNFDKHEYGYYQYYYYKYKREGYGPIPPTAPDDDDATQASPPN